jgi:hypothetical protein
MSLTSIPFMTAINRLWGSISMSATVNMLPAANANMKGRLFLNLKTRNPPSRVEKNVTIARATGIRFIGIPK